MSDDKEDKIDSFSQELITDHPRFSLSSSIQSGADDEEEDPGKKTPATPEKKLPLWRIIAMCTWQIGLTMAWNAMFQTSTPLFKQLGLSPIAVSFANLAGPLSGLIFQPICGVISDEATFRWGRRRPFILFGTIFGLIGMLLFAYPIQ